MSIRTSPWPAGFPCWADLTVPDLDAGKAFYGSVLGWTFEDQGEEFGNYSIAQVKGANAAGISPPMQEGAPSNWTLYLASEDADKTAAVVKQYGGSVLLEPMDVGPLGRMFVGVDPTGAAFGVWQAKQHIGAGIVNEPGALTWDDLRSTDADTARAFYTSVFGFTTDALPDAGPEYTMFKVPGDDIPVGGMGGMFGAPEGTASHWVAYFGTDDADAAAERVTAGGGMVVAPPFDTPYGKMAGVRDPFGAAFWIAQPDPSQQPDRSG